MSFYWLYVFGFACAFLTGVASTRWLRDWAPALGLLDRPTEKRHIHDRPVATVGGIGIFLAVSITLGGLLLAVPVRDTILLSSDGVLFPILLGAACMHLLGIVDDRWNLSPRLKFLAQVVIAVGVFLDGVRLTSFVVPGMGLLELTFWPSLLLTVFWLVAITNAFNLVDGADGLAGGAALMATLAMFVAALVFGKEMAALILVITAGATLGFLHFNFPPASVFLGDGGSLFLGFLLACLGLAGSSKAAAAVAIAIPLVAFGLPVLDTLLAMVRRFLRGAPISKADRRHIHHRLMELGHSPRRVVLILYAVCGGFGLVSLMMLSENGRLISVAFLLMGTVLWFGIQRLRIPELLELRRLLDRGVHQRQVIARNLAMREGVERIARARTLRGAFEELRETLHHSPFEHAEMWLSRDFLHDTAGVELFPEVALTDGGYLWRWRKVPLAAISLRKCWEVKLPVLDSSGEQMGRLTLRRSMDDEMPSEVQVVGDLLLPRMCEAVSRLSVPEASSVSVALWGAGELGGRSQFPRGSLHVKGARSHAPVLR